MQEQPLYSGEDRNFRLKRRHYTILCFMSLTIIFCTVFVIIRGYQLDSNIEPIITSAKSSGLPTHLDMASDSTPLPKFFVAILSIAILVSLLSFILLPPKEGIDLLLIMCIIGAAFLAYKARTADNHYFRLVSDGRIGFISIYDNIKTTKYLISPDSSGHAYYGMEPMYDGLVRELKSVQTKRLYFEIACIPFALIVFFVALYLRHKLK